MTAALDEMKVTVRSYKELMERSAGNQFAQNGYFPDDDIEELPFE